MLVQTELCGRFVVVEGEGSIQTPLFVWTFDGKLYGEIIKGESPSASESVSAPVSEPGSETESSPEPFADPPEDDGESGTAKESSDGQTGSWCLGSRPQIQPCVFCTFIPSIQRIRVDSQFLCRFAEPDLPTELYCLNFELLVINFLRCHFLTSIITFFINL